MPLGAVCLLNGRPAATQTVTVDDVARVHSQPRHWLPLGELSATLTLPDYGRVARNPVRIDAKRGDHCLPADSSGVGNLPLGKSASTITSVQRPPLPPGTETGEPTAARFP